MNREEVKVIVDSMREEGKEVYSISRLNTFNGCQREYYYNYVQRLESKANIYGFLGNAIHTALEDLHENKITEEDLPRILSESLTFAELNGMYFPSEAIKNSWVADMELFCGSFKKLEFDKLELERGFVYEIKPSYYVQGFIDVIRWKDNNIDIVDYKTSSEFKDEKLLSAGRQLVLYMMAMRDLYNINADKLSWYMLKYNNVNFGKTNKMISRRKLGETVKTSVKTQMKKLNYPQFMIDLTVNNILKYNKIDAVPNELKEYFTIEDGIVDYTITEELIQETIDYITTTIDIIESKDKDNIDDWKVCDIKKNKFFCKNLCGHSSNCSEYKAFL